MDDTTFDDLFVPDNWLDASTSVSVTAQKRSSISPVFETPEQVWKKPRHSLHLNNEQQALKTTTSHQNGESKGSEVELLDERLDKNANHNISSDLQVGTDEKVSQSAEGASNFCLNEKSTPSSRQSGNDIGPFENEDEKVSVHDLEEFQDVSENTEFQENDISVINVSSLSEESVSFGSVHEPVRQNNVINGLESNSVGQNLTENVVVRELIPDEKERSVNEMPQINTVTATIFKEAAQEVISVEDAEAEQAGPELLTSELALEAGRSDITAVVDNTSAEKPEIAKIVSIVRDANIISGIVGEQSNFNTIFDLLLENRERENRLDFVTSRLLDESRESNANEEKSQNDIFQEVEKIMNSAPTADANLVFAILESLPAKNRVHRALETLKKDGHIVDENQVQKKNSPITVTSADDPLLRDLETVLKVFPDKDRNKIYTLLKSYSGENRLQSVIDNLLKSEDATVDIAGPSTSAAADFAESVEDDVESLRVLFPDCDPNYLFQELEKRQNERNRKDVLAAEMISTRNYPKLKDVLEKKEKQQNLRKVKNLDITPEEFQKKFPDPVTLFSDETKPTSALYKVHAEVALKNEFRMLQAGYIKTVFLKHSSHFYTAYKDLSESVVSIPIKERKQHKRFLKNLRSTKYPLPEEPDELFYHELWFVQNEQKLADHEKQKEEERKLKLEEARKNGELYECTCCYDDECLFEDLSSCPEGHIFCKVCVLRSTEAAFGELKTKFPCLTGECDQMIPLSTLQPIIPANLFSKIVRRLQEEEVQQANIPDLVTCPFCPFATIMPNPEDKVFKCLNPECLKDSCRLCKEPNHIPLRCNEVEKQSATKMRTFIENRISEAVMRKCHKCNKNFIKDSGCNKMTCMCGATSCYACKAKDIDYGHFNHNANCANADPNVIHQRDMEKAAIDAKKEYLDLHPEAAEVELQKDVGVMIQEYKQLTGLSTQGGRFQNQVDGGGDSDEDDEDEDDEDEEEDEDERYYRGRYGYYRDRYEYYRGYDTSEEDEDEDVEEEGYRPFY